MNLKWKHAIDDWKMFLRELCADRFVRNPVQIGGPGQYDLGLGNIATGQGGI